MKQQNPYQVRNKRFRRRAEQTETSCRISVSQEKRHLYQSPSAKKRTFEDGRQLEPRSFQVMKAVSILSTEAQIQTRKSSASRPIAKLRRKSQFDQQIQFKILSLEQILRQKEERIKILQNLLQQKNFQNTVLKQRLNFLQVVKEEKARDEKKYQEEVHKLQLLSSQQSYKLAQKIKKLEIELAITNKKWKDELDRTIKDKDFQIRSLGDKYSSLIRSNREKLKLQQSSSKQCLSPAFFKAESLRQNDSFELSVSITE